MRWLVAFSIVLATILPVLAEDWTTADGKTYRNVTVLYQEDDGVRITYTGGVGKIPYYELPVEIQKRFGQDLDSLAAKKIAADKALAEAEKNAAIAAQKKQQEEAAAALLPKNAPANVPPGGSPQPSPSSGGGSVPSAAAPSAASPATESTTSTVTTPSGTKITYSGSKLSYNDSLDVCYLDSPAVDVWPVPPPTVPNLPGQGTSLTLRIVTEGQQPQAPDKIEATFLSVGAVSRIGADFDIGFVVDGTKIPIDETAKKDNGVLSGVGQAVEYVSFYLTPAQAKTIFGGNKVQITIGNGTYKIDQAGMAVFQKYFADVVQLPPASSSLVRSYFKFVSRIPSLVSIISTVCEWVILGSFTIIMAATFAAFVLGVTRFMKM